MTLTNVGVDPTLDTTGFRRVLQAVEAVLPFRRQEQGYRRPLFVGTDRSSDALVGKAGVVLQVPSAQLAEGLLSTRTDGLRFSEDPLVPWPYRGRILPLAAPCHIRTLQLQPGERVLLTHGAQVLWTARQTTDRLTFRSAFDLPRFDSGAGLAAILDPTHIPFAMPLLQALKEAGGDHLYPNPRLRASLVIDDPNLHWPRYGYVDYGAIASRAASHNYHVGFATVPLDAWFTHRRTAQLFRDNARWLSLVVHGNNHIKQELARSMSDTELKWLLDQAVSRIEYLERKAGLPICRVMIPPHGACSADVLRHLPLHGFEAACISTGSLQAHNTGHAWTQTLGFSPTERVSGCPVMPRWALSQCSETLLLAAAYLGRPLILRGHHQDLRRGPDMLDAAAASINALGSVVWGNLTKLSRLNYQSIDDAGTLQVKPISNRVEVDLTETVQRLALDVGDTADWRITDRIGTRRVPTDGVIELENSGPTLLLERMTPSPSKLITSHWRRTHPLHIVRRFLAEARDRLLAV